MTNGDYNHIGHTPHYLNDHKRKVTVLTGLAVFAAVVVALLLVLLVR